MNPASLERLPGAEIVLPGLADLEAGRQSLNAHSRYNAILARVASFARAAERARSG